MSESQGFNPKFIANVSADFNTADQKIEQLYTKYESKGYVSFEEFDIFQSYLAITNTLKKRLNGVFGDDVFDVLDLPDPLPFVINEAVSDDGGSTRNSHAEDPSVMEQQRSHQDDIEYQAEVDESYSDIDTSYNESTDSPYDSDGNGIADVTEDPFRVDETHGDLIEANEPPMHVEVDDAEVIKREHDVKLHENAAHNADMLDVPGKSATHNTTSVDDALSTAMKSEAIIQQYEERKQETSESKALDVNELEQYIVGDSDGLPF